MSSVAGGGDIANITEVFSKLNVTSHDGAIPADMKSGGKSDSYAVHTEHDTTGSTKKQSVGPLEWEQHRDELGYVKDVKAPGRPAATYGTDARGAVTTEHLPGGVDSNTHQYEPSGAQKQYQDPTNEATDTDTDLLGRPLTRTYKDGTTEKVEWEGPAHSCGHRSAGSPSGLRLQRDEGAARRGP